MTRSLLPLTRFVLVVSAIVQIIIGLTALLAPGVARSLLYPPPLDAGGDIAIAFYGAVYVASSVAAAYAIRQNDWIAARTYLTYAGVYIVLCVILAVVAIISAVGAPLIMYVYLILALIYLPLVFVVWRRQTLGPT